MSERDIFIAALQKTDAAERSSFLDEACAGDAALRRRLEVLLQAHAQAGRFLEEPLAAPAGTGDYEPGQDQGPPAEEGLAPPSSEAPGTRIGPYKLLQLIGEGGMGAVYLADQEEPVRRRVALKIIKAGMDSRAVVARFEAERQALAMMDHPNIAKVLDAGTTQAGRLFFVMELVKGIPITRYCDQEHLTPKERLELFIPVCQAVQHAHQKGVIHRDLKPSNILIALYDGRPVPKVIDFGIAKATSQRLTEKTLFTEVGQIVGTLEYMAPEQAELNNLDIDTRADIYSLGVLLYELLTGSPPFTAEQLRAAGFNEMLRMIRDVEPPKPSTKLSSSAELPAIAARRKMEPRRLTQLVRGAGPGWRRLSRPTWHLRCGRAPVPALPH
jgi:serine/threonine protein kinase